MLTRFLARRIRLKAHEVLLVSTGLLALLLGTFGLIKVIELRYQELIDDTLRTVLDGTDEGIRIWARDQRWTAQEFAKSEVVLKAAQVLLETQSDNASLLASPAQTELRKVFDTSLKSGRYLGYFIIGPNNTSLASSRDVDVGTPNLLTTQSDILDKLWSGQEMLSRVMKSDVTLTIPLEQHPRKTDITQFVGAPIKNDAGQIIALLTLRSDPHANLLLLLEHGRMGKTGETYAFDRDGIMHSPSRFIPGTAGIRLIDPGFNYIENPGVMPEFSTRPLTLMATSATRGESGANLTGYRDYRGVSVVGAWKWDTELGIGIATEQDTDEAYNMFFLVRRLIYMSSTGVSLVLLTLVLGFRWSRSRLREAQDQLDSIVHTSIDGIVVFDNQGRIGNVNPAMKRLFGYSTEFLIGNNITMLLSEKENTKHAGDWWKFTQSRENGLSGFRSILEGQRRDGSSFPFDLSISEMELESGRHWSGILRDVEHQQKAAEKLLLYANVFEHSVEAIMIADAENRIIAVNQAFTKQTGFSLEDVINKDPKVISSGRTSQETFRSMWANLDAMGYWQGELWDRRKNGEIYPKWTSISVIKNDDGTVANYIASYHDVSDRKAAEEHIYRLAHHDALTGLLNRTSLEEGLGQTLASAQREEQILAVLFIDMDRFKVINDTLGHHSGDSLLIEIAARLKAGVRGCDMVSRLGGDEFVVVLTGLEKETSVSLIASKIIDALGKSYKLEGKTIHSSASIGISVYPADGEDVDTLMKNADTAMYHAKEKGRNNYQFFTDKMNVEVQRRLMLENDLRTALLNSEFELHYQPQITDTDRQIIGVEALLRWQHPDQGLVSPDAFIPLAEETGLIVPIGQWVLETACAQIKTWSTDTAKSRLQLAVNVSARQFHQSGFVALVEQTLAQTGANPERLKIELTESMVLEDIQDTLEKMHALKALGISLSLDDFGTGHSSLSYLTRLPINQLKIDRSFVLNLPDNQDDAIVAQTIITMAQGLGLDVIAEGVETEAQWEFLSRHDCHSYQGYLFSRPLPLDEFELFAQLNELK